MKIGIAGWGHVGKHTYKEFNNSYIYDPNQKLGNLKELNKCDVVFIAVPTPENKDGSCDTSIIENLISKLKVKLIIIRSTVYVGFTDYIANKFNINVVFQPEYYGETVDHPFAKKDSREWISLGGSEESINLAINVYKTIKNSNIKINQGNAKDIEMAKYMENAFLATKVTFVNEMYDIAKKLGVNFNIAREAWVSDPRIGRSHTFVYEEKRGYSGKCLPKDIASIKKQADDNDVDSTLVTAVIDKNKKIYKN